MTKQDSFKFMYYLCCNRLFENASKKYNNNQIKNVIKKAKNIILIYYI